MRLLRSIESRQLRPLRAVRLAARGATVTASRPQRRKATGPRELPPGAWEHLIRARAFIRPLLPPVPLHKMGRARPGGDTDDVNPEKAT